MLFGAKIWKELIVIPKMIWVSAFVHVWQVSIRKLNTVTKITFMTNLKMAFRKKQDTITKRISSTVFSWFSMMGLPAPVCVFSSVGSANTLATGCAQSSLPFPSLLYSIRGKGHCGTSRVEVSNPRVKMDGSGMRICGY
jgi:hypothetical protein